MARRRELSAGGLMAAAGIAIAVRASAYELGSLRHMGPGFFPAALGGILIILGGMIAAAAWPPGPPAAEAAPTEPGQAPGAPSVRAWVCILLGPLLFIGLGRTLGLIPATFACVFVAAWGDREATLRGSLGLAAIVTMLGVIVFWWLLQVPLPLLQWGGDG